MQQMVIDNDNEDYLASLSPSSFVSLSVATSEHDDDVLPDASTSGRPLLSDKHVDTLTVTENIELKKEPDCER